MTDGDARKMIRKYSTSAYFREGGIALATRTPPPTPAELVAGMESNVAEARIMKKRVQERFVEARRDGLFDSDMLGSVGDRVQDLWVAAIDMMDGDKVRCISELNHWIEYFDWAVKTTRGKIQERGPGSDDE